MTDPERDDRIDLSALGIAHDDGQARRVVDRAMDRISTPSILAGVVRWWYPGLAAAALVMLVAGATVATTDPKKASDDNARVAARLDEWVRSGHVPDNGELFATFHGLDR